MKLLRKTLAVLLVICFSGGLFTFIPSLFSSAITGAEEINEYTALYTSFDMGAVDRENYFAVPMRGYYDAERSENVHSVAPNNWAMLMVESVSAPQATPASRVPENLADGDSATSYMTNAEFPIIIGYKMREPVNVVVYSVTSTNNYNMNAPMDWTFEGSFDGDDWTVLHTVEGQTFAKRSQTKKFSVENAEYYEFYRIVITKKAGEETSGTLQFSDLTIRENGGANNLSTGALLAEIVEGGPTSTFIDVGGKSWNGTHCMRVTGDHSGTGRGYSNAYIFDHLMLPVTENTYFSYNIFPDFENIPDAKPEDNYDYEYTSQYVALDIRFTDGTYLSDLGAVDQNRHGISARAQGETKALYTRNWNMIETRVGDWAAGKTIDKIVVVYDKPSNEGEKSPIAYIDDVKICDRAPLKCGSLVDYTDPRRGSNDGAANTNRGLTYPAVCVPHAFNLWTPSTNDGHRQLYRYHPSNVIQHFMITHQASFHLFDYAAFMFMPNTSVNDPSRGGLNCASRKCGFSRDNEICHANYYSVLLDEDSPASGVRVEIAPTDHAGIVRFTFPQDAANVNVILDSVCSYIGRDGMEAAWSLTIAEDAESFSAVIDYGSTKLDTYYPRMYLYGCFDQLPESGVVTDLASRDIGAVTFAKGTTEVVMRLATSYMSVAQAEKNLRLEIADTDTLEDVKERGAALWNELLGVVEAEGMNEEETVALYSNIYRLNVFPTNMSENTGTADEPHISHIDLYHSSFENPVIKDGILYTTNGFWDTYRTAWAAYALLTPELDGEMLDGLIAHYNDIGWIGRWLNPGGVNAMAGTSSDVIFGDAAAKGIEFDREGAFLSAVRNASTPSSGNFGRPNVNINPFAGVDNYGNLCWHLESAINDYGIAQLAKSLGLDAEYMYYMDRAKDYKNDFSDELDFFVKYRYGAFSYNADTYDPYDWSQGYIETNGWGTAFSVTQDGNGLAQLYGGKDGLAAKLEELLNASSRWEPGSFDWQHEMYEAREVRMGQYQHSNQPSHHILYMFNCADQPYRTQALTREALGRLFVGNRFGQGYIGDEDNGEMSAWYILSALGFYPLNMGSGEYAITSPLYKKYTLHLPSGDLVVTAENNSAENVYIQSMKIDGVPYYDCFITHEELLKAKEITFVMGSEPSDWGVGSDFASATGKREKLTTAEDYADEAEKTYSGITSGSSMFINNSSTPGGVNGAGTIDFSFAEPKKVEMITVTSGRTQNMTVNIKLYGSETKDGEYTELINEQGVNYQWTQYIRPFKVAEPAEYKYYRLELSGSGSFQIGEIELLGGFHNYDDVVEGDIDADGEVSVVDALAALRIALGLAPARDAAEVADMDSDGAITVSDALLILKKAARLI